MFAFHYTESWKQRPKATCFKALCRPMTVKRDMRIWIGEKDFAGCPSNTTVFSFPTFLPRSFFLFKEVLGGWLDDHPLEQACSTAGGGGLKWHSRLIPPPQGDLHRDQDESLLRLGVMRNPEERAKHTCVRRVNLVCTPADQCWHIKGLPCRDVISNNRQYLHSS